MTERTNGLRKLSVEYKKEKKSEIGESIVFLRVLY
jgi:hypothetical protein